MKNYITSFKLFENTELNYARLIQLGIAEVQPDRRIDGQRPHIKDLDRARDLVAGSNPLGRAVSMSKLITDPEKLIRRAKAVASEIHRQRPEELGTIFAPFAKRLRELGFNENGVQLIMQYGLGNRR